MGERHKAELRPFEISQSATEGELPVIKRNSLIASLVILLAACAWPVNAQESYRGRASGRSGLGQTQARPMPRNTSRPASHGHPQHSHVAQASGQMMVDEREYVQAQPIEESMGQEIIMGEGIAASCNGHCTSGCDSCGQGGYCTSCNTPRRFCICLPSHGWAHVEYLLWWQNGMDLPALVSSSPAGTAQASAGVLPTASVLYGADNSALDGSRSGGRIRFGSWFDRCPGLGFEGEYLGLGKQTESFFQQSTGTPILARPFFNIVSGAQDADLVAFPNLITGSVGVDVTSELNGAAARFRRSLCGSSGSAYSPICCTTVPTSSRLDSTLGYRYFELKESLIVHERTQSTLTNSPGSFDILDRFDTRNQFNGGEVGVIWQGRRGLWSLDGLMRVAIGNTHQTVTIAGATSTLENGTTTNYTSGILAQRTNAGTYDRNEFGMIPELGVTLGYQLSRRVRLTTGYSLIYWGNVARPGDQVDLDLNPNLFPPESDPFTGALRPEFQFVSSDYWVQGLSFGADIRW